jgi:excisionase family DNA binding protein
MKTDIYFPLFQQIMRGGLNPHRPENEVGQNYTLRLQEQIVANYKLVGIFGLTYLKPQNEKCSYYQRMMVPETLGYCEDMLEYLSNHTDERERSYLRHDILDGHLATSLKYIGDVIKDKNYRLEELTHPAADGDWERLSNIYIFHLLKVCVAKAYMEVQAQLSDVVTWKYTEAVLYSSFVGEVPPVRCFLKKLTEEQIKSRTKNKVLVKESEALKGNESLTKESPSDGLIKKQDAIVVGIVEKGFAETCYTVKEVAKKLNRTETTILRNIKSEKIRASFDGSMYWIDREWFDAYMAALAGTKKLK